MSPAPERLEDAAWITDPAAVAVLDALEAAGGPDCVRFVGGCVRNAVMGRPIADIDLATCLEPKAVMSALAAAGLESWSCGLRRSGVSLEEAGPLP